MSIRAVADAVGVSPPSIYMHFADKAGLVYAVCERGFCELDAYVESRVSGIADPVRALLERGRAYVRFGLDHPEQYRILFMSGPVQGPEHFTPERMGEMAGFQHLVDNVEACINAGAIGEQDAFLVAVGLWSAVHGITSLRLASPHFPWPDLDRLVDHVAAVHLRGLAR